MDLKDPKDLNDLKDIKRDSQWTLKGPKRPNVPINRQTTNLLTMQYQFIVGAAAAAAAV
jgi:hypothetical protein